MQCYRKKLKLIDKSSLGLNNNVFVNENFTPVNSKIFYNCRKLKRNNLISKTYTVNGTVHLISDQKKKNGKPVKTLDIKSLIYLLPDFKFRVKNEIDDANNLADKSHQSSH